MKIDFWAGLSAIISGMLTVFKHLFKRPVTLEYPEKRRIMNPFFRGKPYVTGCVGCGICKNVCPAGAIDFAKDENGNVIKYTFDLKKCIFCGNCAFYCPKNAINMSEEFELASENLEGLKLNYKGGNND